jgi:hypothetical protein
MTLIVIPASGCLFLMSFRSIRLKRFFRDKQAKARKLLAIARHSVFTWPGNPVWKKEFSRISSVAFAKHDLDSQ